MNLGSNQRYRIFDDAVGMDGRWPSQSPWELLVNVRPSINGYESVPQNRSCGNTSDTDLDFDEVYLARPWTVFGKTRFVIIGRIGTSAYLAILASNGRKLAYVDIDYPDDKWPSTKYPWAHSFAKGTETLCAVDLFDQMFIGTKEAVYVIAPRSVGRIARSGWSDYGIRAATSVGGIATFAEISWRTGLNQGDWPYVTGSLGAPVLASHMNRLWLAGFHERQIITMDTTLTDAQQKVAGIDTVGVSQFYCNSRYLLWSDANDPYAVSGFVSVPIGKPITAMLPFGDSLYLFAEDEVWRVSGTEEPWEIRRVESGPGASSASSVVATPIAFMCANKSGVWAVQVDPYGKTKSTLLSRPVEHLFSSLSVPNGWDYSSGSALKSCSSVDAGSIGTCTYLPVRNEVWFPCRTRSSAASLYLKTEYSAALVYCLDNGAWWYYSPGLARIHGTYDTPDGCVQFLGTRMTTFSRGGGGSAVAGTRMGGILTKPLASDVPYRGDFARLYGVRALFRRCAGGKCLVGGWETGVGGGEDFSSTNLITCNRATADASLWGDATWVTGETGGGKWSSRDGFDQDIDTLVSSRSFRIGFEFTGPFDLRGVELLYKAGGR